LTSAPKAGCEARLAKAATPDSEAKDAALAEIDDIAAALVRLAADNALREAVASRGLEQARQFTWESAVERTWEVYREFS